MITETGLAAVHAAVHSQPTQPAPAAAPTASPAPAPAVAAPGPSPQPPVPQPATAETSTAATLAAKQRISTILKLESAKGREAMAQTLALDTDVPVEQADALLKSAPVAASAGTAFRDAMKDKNPQLGTGASATVPGQPSVPTAVKIDSRAIYTAYNGVGKK
jgi:hypothetical protein